jgi:trimeric autotransporter adhesin
MSLEGTGARAALGALVMLLTAALAPAHAIAESTITACVPYSVSTGKLATGKAIVAGTETGTCKNTSSINYHPLNIPAAGGFETLDKLLSHMTFTESGVGGKPTIQFSGVNIQIVSGAGKTSAAVNGEGNLVIGYDENGGKHEQTGSHDLILGEEQTFTSYGGIVAGWGDTISAPFASVSGGRSNSASRESASVSGGINGVASGFVASVSGGRSANATGNESWVGGGFNNIASGEEASASGGYQNVASGGTASVSGGFANKVPGVLSWVGGGFENTVNSKYASIFGGNRLTANGEVEACGGSPTKLNC